MTQEPKTPSGGVSPGHRPSRADRRARRCAIAREIRRDMRLRRFLARYAVPALAARLRHRTGSILAQLLQAGHPVKVGAFTIYPGALS